MKTATFTKNILAVIIMMVATIAVNAQIKVNHITYNGDNCWLLEPVATVSFDKDPLTGSSKTDIGGLIRLNRYHKGFYAFAEGGYERGGFAGNIGAGYKLAKKTWKIQPAIEAGVGFGNQYCGYSYEAAAKEETEAGKLSVVISQDFLDCKLKPQAFANFKLEFRVADRVSITAGVGAKYRFSEAKTLTPSGDFEVNGKKLDPSVGSINLQTSKVIMTASLSVKWSFYAL